MGDKDDGCQDLGDKGDKPDGCGVWVWVWEIFSTSPCLCIFLPLLHFPASFLLLCIKIKLTLIKIVAGVMNLS
ncbi:MAG: hypothetical protein ACHBN1_15840 [Heteroscytonema crispum UTEX LB 1556]